MLFGHGDDIYNTERSIRLNFSSNVWYGTELAPLKRYLGERFDQLKSYPDPDAGVLKRILSRRLEIPEECLLVANGSITAFYLIAQAWQGARSAIAIPTFAEYEDACRLYRHRLHFFSCDGERAFESLEGQDLCWICNPNNPDGRLLRRSELLSLVTANPDTTFVIDQAYAAFTTEALFSASDVMNYRNLILVHSISKAYCTPGLRIGYLVASRQLISRIYPYLIPWSVNAMAIEAGRYILTHPAAFTLPIRRWLRETSDFIRELSQLEEVEVFPSSTSFFLVRLKDRKASDLKAYLLDKGILIRDASNFRGLDEHYIRLSTRTVPENEECVARLKHFFSE